MSFRVNNKNPYKVNYNQNEVKTIYYNEELVWEKPNTIDWDELYDLCKQRQAGTIEAFPDIVQLGMKMTVHYYYQGHSWEPIERLDIKVRLIDIETEGPGILIFQQYQAFGLQYSGAPEPYNGFLAYDFSNYPEIADYVIPLTKYGFSTDISGNITDHSLSQYGWDLSLLEVDSDLSSYNLNITTGYTKTITDDYTKNTKNKYPYLDNPENRICYGPDGEPIEYALRSFSQVEGASNASGPIAYADWSNAQGRDCIRHSITANGSIDLEGISTTSTFIDYYRFGCFAIG